MSYSAPSNGRYDNPPTGSDLKSRDKWNQLAGRIGTMRGWFVDQVKALRGLDFTEKKEPVKKPETPKPAEAAKEEKKEEKKDDKKDAKK